ncbi:C-5 sterol desaturase [Streptomyces fodineus]|uniref:C-5 sterol desaturase n=2 Tax=Streptomyces fodineus TaxID=1904616 RepID=A0A1D7YP83_9ACTN|nr:C-5 sterol desaturase [Streptomyces fodineus]
MKDLPYALLFSIVMPSFVILLLAEWITWRRKRNRDDKRGFLGRDTTNSLLISLLSQFTGPLERAVLPFSFVVVASALTPWHMPADAWWTWVVGMVVTDFCYYWAHRADHRIRFLWAAHSVHHSSEYFNLSTAVRTPAMMPQAIFLRNAAFIPAGLAGVPAYVILFCQTLGLIYQWPLHTERVGKLPRPIEFVFNTPSHHRVHHGSNNPYLDKNYGAILIIWDRMFGSYAPELDVPTYGLTKNIGTYNPLKTNFHELWVMLKDVRNAPTWHGRWITLFGPPGASVGAVKPPVRVEEPVA